MTPDSPLLMTLGHGKRTIDDVIARLNEHHVAFLVDVRSVPWSRFQPDFSRDALQQRLPASGISYLFLGEELGGRPKDRTCYDEHGRVNYDACMRRPAFQHGIQRLKTAWEQGRRVALLCSERRPEECHRSKLVGKALVATGLDVTHLDENDALVTQEQVMSRAHAGQVELFPDLAIGKAARSRGKYRPGE